MNNKNFVDFSDTIKVLDKEIKNHLKKFVWDWINKLAIKWLVFYYKKYWKNESKDVFLDTLNDDLKKYVNYFLEERKANESRNERRQRYTENRFIYERYNELIHDWDDNNPILDNRNKVLSDTNRIVKIKTPT